MALSGKDLEEGTPRKTPWFLLSESKHLILLSQQGCAQSERVKCLKGHQSTLRILGTRNDKLASSPLPSTLGSWAFLFFWSNQALGVVLTFTRD